MRTPVLGPWLCALLALAGLTCSCAAPARQLAIYREVDRSRVKQELISKLTSDINKVDHSIEVTRGLILSSPDAPYLAELTFRLAELYVERSRYVYARLMEQQPEGDAVLGADKALEVQISKRLAIETYSRILIDYPDYERNDQVRFFRAHEYRELGEWETMLKEYEELKQKFPKSDWAIEARLILGDYYFDKGELPTAEVHYREILGLPESHLHDMARYKLGWIRINQEKFAEALALFEAAVASGRKQKRGAIGDAHKLNVKREALLALAWPFSEVKKAPQAPQYFLDLAESKTLYVEALKRLANRYFVKTEYTNAALLYREVAALSADVEQNVDFVQRIYDSVRNMPAKDPRRYASAATDVEAIVETVARFENTWKFSDQEKGQLKRDFELRARDLATRLHLEAKRKGDEESARVAALAYKRYLSLFTDTKQRRTIEVNRAEALFQAKAFVDAGEQYEDVARELPDGQERRDLLYSAVLAFHQALDADAVTREKNPTGGGLLDPWQRLRAREGEKQIGAYYVRAWPKSDKVANVKFNVAKMYYQQGEYERAAELFAAFVEQYPGHADVNVAGNLALDAWHRLERFDELAKLAQAFVDNPKIKSVAFKNEARQIGDAARKRKVEMAVISSGDGDFSARMLDEWEKHKDDKQGEEFLYAAFMKFLSEGNVGGVFDFGGRLLGAYPQSPRVNEVLGAMGAFAVRAADFERAASLFEEMAKRGGADPKAQDALTSAANLRYLLGDLEHAAANFRALLASGNATQQRLANEKLFEIFREAQAWGDLAKAAAAAQKAEPGWLRANFYLGLAKTELGDLAAAQRELGRAVEAKARDGADREAQGQALFALGHILQREFDSLQFTDKANIEAVVGRKIQLRDAIEQLQVRALNAGTGEWGIAALQELARLYHSFGTFLAGAPVPDGLGEADRRQYEQDIRSNAQSFESKAVELVKACAQKAEELKVFTPYARACMTQSLELVVPEAGQRRAPSLADDAYKAEVANLRQELAKTPESAEVQKKLARRALQVGDYHLARLVLGKAIEANANDAVAQNLWGVASWRLGEPQQAMGAFERALAANLPAAAANLAALCNDYGYARLAQRYLTAAGALKTLDLTAPDYHPSVAKLAEDAR